MHLSTMLTKKETTTTGLYISVTFSDEALRYLGYIFT